MLRLRRSSCHCGCRGTGADAPDYDDDQAGCGRPCHWPPGAGLRWLATRQFSDSYRLASAILGDPNEARDAVHDAFVTAWRKWSTLRDHQRFDAWFGRIVVNTCRDRLRRGSRLTTDDGALAESLPAADPIAPIHERSPHRGGSGPAERCARDDQALALGRRRDGVSSNGEET